MLRVPAGRVEIGGGMWKRCGAGAPATSVRAGLARADPCTGYLPCHSAYSLVIAGPMVKPQAKIGKFLNFSGTT